MTMPHEFLKRTSRKQNDSETSDSLMGRNLLTNDWQYITLDAMMKLITYSTNSPKDFTRKGGRVISTRSSLSGFFIFMGLRRVDPTAFESYTLAGSRNEQIVKRAIVDAVEASPRR